MIKLFKNTRRKLLSKNKFSKYLAYAIGEIFLVVVGILIALWINNKNQERIYEAKAKTILREIQKDLKKDIKESKGVVNRFITHDSIARLLLWDKLTTHEMFNGTNGSPYEIVYQGISFETSDNGYLNFKGNLNNIPTKYNTITNKLKELYDSRAVELEVSNERIRSIVFENLDKINRFDWHVESIKNGLPEEAKNYYMRDLEFKKTVLKYMNGIENVFLSTEVFKSTAIQLHNKISDILDIDDYIPYSPTFSSNLGSLEGKNILGKYKLKETVSQRFPPIIELREVDNKLQLYAEGLPEVQYYWNDKTTFLYTMDHGERLLTYITFNRLKNSEFFISVSKSEYAYYTKVKD